jgi:oxygen-independent coproporphyrinogen-3 oxidase
MVTWDAKGFHVRQEGRALTRLIARAFDEYEMREEGHSSAI